MEIDQNFYSSMDPLETLSAVERNTYEEFRKRVEENVPLEIRSDPYLYLRFLRARDFNSSQSETMLRNHLIWRKANQIDNEKFKEYRPDKILSKYLPISFFGYDKEGSPMRYVDFGQLDAKGLQKSFKKSDVMKAIVHYFEDDVIAMKEQSDKLGKPIQQWNYVLNFGNFSLAKATHKQSLELFISVFMVYEANYPERLKSATVINASYYFNIFFTVMKPMLSGATLKKITIYGKDGWKDALLKIADPDVLPVFLGGNKTDPDGNPMCKTFITHGVPVPQKYFMVRTTNRLHEKSGVKKLNVSRLSKIQLTTHVSEPGSTLEWEFETEDKDIAFELLCKPLDSHNGPAKVLIPKERIDAHLSSEVGMFQCDEAGTYIIIFDNSYSWIYQKEIYCKVELVTPKGHRIPLNEM